MRPGRRDRAEARPPAAPVRHKLFCPAASMPDAACECGAAAAAASTAAAAETAARRGDGVVRVGRETQGRQGKGVTVIHGLPLDDAALAALAQELKRRCGTGGSVRGRVIELQGDHRDALLEELAGRGYRVKKAGG